MAASETRTRGYEILRGAIPEDPIDCVLRRIHQDIATRGLPQEWLSEWLWNANWFPHLRWDAEVVGLLEHLPAELRAGELCDPQILLQMPDAAEELELHSHIDQEPPWANGRRYERILGVALTPNTARTGGLNVWPLDGSPPEALDLAPGDVVVMDPQLPHASGLNRTGTIRYAVYFRFLER